MESCLLFDLASTDTDLCLRTFWSPTPSFAKDPAVASRTQSGLIKPILRKSINPTPFTQSMHRHARPVVDFGRREYIKSQERRAAS